jgi:hypothetical protein
LANPTAPAQKSQPFIFAFDPGAGFFIHPNRCTTQAVGVESWQFVRYWEMHVPEGERRLRFGFQTGNSSLGDCPIALVARAMLDLSMSRETKATAAHNNNH